MRRAVVDVGSNSVLLLVAEQTPQGWIPVLETSKVTGLGRGTKSSGLLSEDGMSATLVALKSAFEAARQSGTTGVTAAATMAARIATNTKEFQERAAAQGTPIIVLSGQEEAELGALSVSSDPLFSSAGTLSIVDVGGHSTEVATHVKETRGWTPVFQQSFPIGALGLREGSLKDDRPSREARLQAVVEIDDKLGFRYRPGECGTVVTLGATGTNLVTIREKMTRWDALSVHGSLLQYEEIARAFGWLCELDDAGRASLVGIEPGREHTLHAGTLILERALFALGAEVCYVSVRGWRHGFLERSAQ
ncbi:MAG: hypothetical protein JSS66_10650 [Armatimonadetes bacterium]|nr:hypothetical protein [Armatimonadota bacterium]